MNPNYRLRIQTHRLVGTVEIVASTMNAAKAHVLHWRKELGPNVLVTLIDPDGFTVM